MKQKRLVTVQDISCIGKCSLSAALPIISSFGIETAVLPTALLSTHTGIDGFTFCDLTDQIPKITAHWQEQSYEFDAMYSGYLGNEKQLDIVKEFFTKAKNKSNFIFVDPVMGDDGKLYRGFEPSFAQKMKELCKIADIITPNVTEACLLCNEEYKEDYDESYIKSLCVKLSELGVGVVIITGVCFGNSYGAICYDKIKNSYFSYYKNRISGTYSGTGDIFASTLCGAIVKGYPFQKALKLAIDFVYESILATEDEKDKFSYGVKFEQCLSMITNS